MTRGPRNSVSAERLAALPFRPLLDESSLPLPAQARSRRRVLRWLLPAGLIVALTAALWSTREPTEPLTPERLAAARTRWQASGIRDYDLTVRVAAQTYRAEVRGGDVVRLTADGRPASSHDPQAYAVDGWFLTLQRELELHEDAGPAAPIIRVRFNRDLGYVERYLRASSTTGAAQLMVTESLHRHPRVD